MTRTLIAVTAAVLVASSATALEQRRHAIHATPPVIAHPLPQGVPYLTVGAIADPIVELRYGVVNGKRVLLNARTLEVVYILHP